MSRRRYAYTRGGVPLPEPVEVPDDFQSAAERMPIFGDGYMDGTRSPLDGADIGSRTKRREYMKLRGLADASDYSGTWEKAAQHRAAIQTGAVDKSERRAQVARAMEKKR